MKIYLSILAFVVSLNGVLATSFEDSDEIALRSYFKEPTFIPAGPFSEERGYEVFLRLKCDKHLDTRSIFSSLPEQPLALQDLQDELSGEIQAFIGAGPLNYTERLKYPLIPEEFYHDLYKIGCFFLQLAGTAEDSLVSDIKKTSRKWFYRATLGGHVYAWYGLGFVWLMDHAEEGNSSANYYLSVLSNQTFKCPEVIIKNRDVYRQRAIQKRNPYALEDQSHVEEDKQEYQKALDLLKEAHHLGAVVATYRLGHLYYYGHGAKALYFRLLSGEQIPQFAHITFTKEDDRIVSFDSNLKVKNDITEEYNGDCGIVPDKELAFSFFKNAADRGYIPAILAMRELFKKLEYSDPLSPTEEVKAIEGYKGTFIDFLNVIFPNLNGNYRIIESLVGNFAYDLVYVKSTEHWLISSSMVDTYLLKRRLNFRRDNWNLPDLEKKIFEETVLPKISHTIYQSKSR